MHLAVGLGAAEDGVLAVQHMWRRAGLLRAAKRMCCGWLPLWRSCCVRGSFHFVLRRGSFIHAGLSVHSPF